jgi:hypothetical protein
MTEIERLAELLRRLPPAPTPWVRAAQELPRARGELEEIVARAEADMAFRKALLRDLESALADAGFHCDDPRLIEELRSRLPRA